MLVQDEVAHLRFGDAVVWLPIFCVSGSLTWGYLLHGSTDWFARAMMLICAAISLLIAVAVGRAVGWVTGKQEWAIRTERAKVLVEATATYDPVDNWSASGAFERITPVAFSSEWLQEQDTRVYYAMVDDWSERVALVAKNAGNPDATTELAVWISLALVELSVRNVVRVRVHEKVQWLRTHPTNPPGQWQIPTACSLELLPIPATNDQDTTHPLVLEFQRLLERNAVSKNAKTIHVKSYRKQAPLAHKPLALSELLAAMLAVSPAVLAVHAAMRAGPEGEKRTLATAFSPVVQEARKFLRAAPAPSNEHLAGIFTERERLLWLLRAVHTTLGEFAPVQSLDWVPVVLT